VHLTPESPYGPYWSVTKYRDIVQVEVNHKVFSSSDEVGGIMINDAPKGMERTSFIRLDPPEHDELRREVSSTVNPITLTKMEGLIRERTSMVLNALPRGETFNRVERVSIELTSMMLATLFDYPVDQKVRLIRWSDTFICDINAPDAPVRSEEARFAEQMRFAEHMNEIWEELARKPKSFDVISILAYGEATNQMTLRQRMGILILFLVGGNDTTRNSMSGGLLGLSQFPDQFRKLRENHELVTSTVSEIVRWQTPVIHMRRTAMEDAEIGGRKIRSGDKVVVWYISGNRNEESIERPNEFIVDRRRPREHMSFGFGIHRCLGNRLAEMQLRIRWEEILQRSLQIEVLDKPVYAYSNFLHSIRTYRCELPHESPPGRNRGRYTICKKSYAKDAGRDLHAFDHLRQAFRKLLAFEPGSATGF
jgi:cytochrome P450